MTAYLLDTNHLGDAIRKVSHVRDRLQLMARKGHRFGCCLPALSELKVGIQQRIDSDECNRRLRSLLKAIRVWPMDQNVASLFATFYLYLRSQGRALSQVVLMLAAQARSMDLTLMTNDSDFKALPEVQTENWLS